MNHQASFFGRIAAWIARQAGRPAAFLIALALLCGWLIIGPWFKFSDTWLLLIDTIMTTVTFLMVFIIQNTQNRETKALHLKIDELIRSTKEAENALMAAEEMNEEELEKLKLQYSVMGQAKRSKGIKPLDPPT